MWNFRSLLLVRVRSIFLSRGWQHQNAFSCSHSSKVVRKGFGIRISITYVPLRNGPDKSRQVLLRQAAENAEVVKDAVLRQAAENAEVVKDAVTAAVQKVAENPELGKDASKAAVKKVETILPIGTIIGSVLATVSGGSAMFGAFNYFSALGHNVADLKDNANQTSADLKDIAKQTSERMDAYNARFDAYNARFDKMYIGTVSITLGVPALLMIGLGVLKENGK